MEKNLPVIMRLIIVPLPPFLWQKVKRENKNCAFHSNKLGENYLKHISKKYKLFFKRKLNKRKYNTILNILELFKCLVIPAEFKTKSLNFYNAILLLVCGLVTIFLSVNSTKFKGSNLHEYKFPFCQANIWYS